MTRLTTRTDKAYLVKGAGSVKVQRWKPPHLELARKVETTLEVGLLQLYYPSWVARIDGGSTRLEVRPSIPDSCL